MSHGLNGGMVGIGAENSVASIDNVAVQVLPPEFTLRETETFEDGVADRFTTEVGAWQIVAGRYEGLPAAGEEVATATMDLNVLAAYLLRLDTVLSTQGLAGVVSPGRLS